MELSNSPGAAFTRKVPGFRLELPLAEKALDARVARMHVYSEI